jgi:WD40 repeat protein
VFHQVSSAHNLLTSFLFAGFEITARYTDHAGPVRQAIYNPKADRVVSLDSRALHCWRFTGHVESECVTTIRYPRGAYNFVTCVAYSDSAKLVFCSCLDSCLRIYKNDMQLKSVLAWDQTYVYDMHFLHSTNEIIASGLQGLKVPSITLGCMQ